MCNTGVYQIKNIVNGKIYIGSASSKFGFNSRWSRHVFDLKNGKHHSKHLQSSWDKYGSDKFKFEILEEETIKKYNIGYISRKQLSIEYQVCKSTIDNILSKNKNKLK